MNTTGGPGISGYMLLLGVQILLLIVYAAVVRYDDRLLPNGKDDNDTDEEDLIIQDDHVPSYPHFQDIHVMIFVGFAFLMTFLKRYGYSATGFNLFFAALIVQWAIVARGIFDLEDGQIKLSLDNIIGADIAAAAVLISMGAMLGRITPIQLLLMGLIEIVVFAANEHLQLEMMSITDVGGSITVHAFGAYFGLTVSFMLRPKSDHNNAGKMEGPSYVSDLFAMIGTLFLWIFWPSFNSALLDGVDQERAILNTYLALASCTVTAFIISAVVSHDHKLSMVHVQNSTLAGGVAVGTVCNLMIGPHGAMLNGMIAALVSVVGYRYLTPILTSKLRLHDSCGVNNLHGMPAILSAIFSAVYAALAKEETYHNSLTTIFPAMDATAHNGTFVIGGYSRSPLTQGSYQLLAVGLTILIAIVSGAVTGLVLRSPCIRKLEKHEHHDDSVYWETPDDDEIVSNVERLNFKDSL
ncbi:ammonium transporter Rh type A-like [Bradysia coprophila]|uniref:ammonium transporter Rh type A-like n=1 Tax=Bradysia coprophila TaxID=38358 RepID=UPI00187D9DBD|nr:ammonium transporter Rh type A-like [Bradysia coprophila]